MPLSALERLRTYRQTLVHTFLREFTFLSDVVAGRAQARGDYTDKILAVFKMASGGLFDQLPGGSVVQGAFDWAVDTLHDDAKVNKVGHIQALHEQAILAEEENIQHPEKLYILIQEVAREAAYCYEYAITKLLAENSIIPFAYVGVERMLEYITRTRCPLSKETLLIGLIEGRSGAYVKNFSNNRIEIDSNHPHASFQYDRPFTAEGLYGRSGLQSQETGKFYVLKKENALHKKQKKALNLEELHECYQRIVSELEQKQQGLQGKLKTQLELVTGVAFGKILTGMAGSQWKKFSNTFRQYGYTTFIDEDDAGKGLNAFKKMMKAVKHLPRSEKLPKYGYARVPQSVIERYYGHALVEHTPSQVEYEQLNLDHYKATVYWVSTSDMKAYYEVKHKTPSLLTFMRNRHHSNLTTVVYRGNLSRIGSNWQGVDLSYVDFSDVSFEGVDLTNAQCKESILLRSQFDGCKGSKIVLWGAQAHYVSGKRWQLEEANLSQAGLCYAVLTNANLVKVIDRGTRWIGANLEDVQQTQDWLKELVTRQKKAIDDLDQRQHILREADSDLALRIKGLEDQIFASSQAENLMPLVNRVGCLEQQQTTMIRESRTELVAMTQQMQQCQNDTQQTLDLVTQMEQKLAEMDVQHKTSVEAMNKWLDRFEKHCEASSDAIDSKALEILHQNIEDLASSTQRDLGLYYQRFQTNYTQLSDQLTQLETRVHKVESEVHVLKEEVVEVKEDVIGILAQLGQIQSRLAKAVIEPYEVIPRYMLNLEEKPLRESEHMSFYLGTFSGYPVMVKQYKGYSLIQYEGFKREIQILRRLRHPQIVTFYGGMVQRNDLYVVMEHLPLGGLDTIIEKKSTLTPVQQKQIALELVQGLIYLHGRSILHRNITPRHILVDENWHVKLTGFSCAKVVTDSIATANFSINQSLPRWQSPEYFKYKEADTEKSDIFSIGMVLWSLLTGKLPYAEINDFTNLAKEISKGQVESDFHTLPASYKAVIQSCCHLDPNKRPAATALLRQIQEITLETPLTAEDYYHKALASEKEKAYSSAYQYYQKAIQTDSSFFRAYTNIGFFQLQGIHVQPDKRLAHENFLMAANLGHPRAMHNLARMLEYGDGVDKDIEGALHWYEKLVDRGDEEAKKKVEELRQSIDYKGNWSSFY